MSLISIAPEILARQEYVALGCLRMKARVKPSGDDLHALIADAASDIHGRLSLEDIHDIPAIGATRAAYRACGKEPSRYRPSAEALLRRIVSGKGLYEINNVVDLLNCISIRTGYSIGGFDEGMIRKPVSLGIGTDGEPYEAIARGALNIEFLPVLRDALGAFGTPTSDSVRTGVTAHTTDLLMVFYDFAGDAHLPAILEETAALYVRYCHASDIQIEMIAGA